MIFKKLVTSIALVSAFSFTAQADIIAATDFDGRDITAGGVATSDWTTNGVSPLLSLTASADLFDSADSQDLFAVNNNIQTVGPWTADIALNVLADEIALDMLSFDAFIFNGGGSFQATNGTSRDVDFTATILDFNANVLGSQVANNVYPSSGVYVPGTTVSFDFSSLSLLANTNYVLRIMASSDDTVGNNAGIDNLSLTGTVGQNNAVNVSAPSMAALFTMVIAGLYLRKKSA
ncbi:hypothetical protein ACOI22_15730 [Glaciecola sp. 2405UD65-10]|uniref:hypothetical protein n=1 Tax=Glaciecola sp. 2405UD65-10 TaxID=3397244 RepID=UPI003B58C6E9